MIISWSGKQKKILHTIVTSVLGAASDVAVQLSSGTLNVTRAVIVGLCLGALVRIAGALISAIESSE
jgi:hypothetical protein